jgi:farnesol dehydrogenase
MDALSLTGSSALWLALGIWVKSLTGSTAAAGMVIFAILAPPVLLAPVAGMLVDRVRRRPLLVIVNPGRGFGPGHLTEGNSLTKVIDLYDRGKMPFLLGGGRNVGNWVLVDDVVQGLISAMDHGRSGEKYLLGGENLSLKQFLQLVDQASGKRHVQITIRRPASMTYAWLHKQRAAWLGIYPQITPDWVRVFLTEWAYSSEKAQRHLGYQITPLNVAVRRTYEWLLRVRAAGVKVN